MAAQRQELSRLSPEYNDFDRKVTIGRFDQKMMLIVHEAVRMTQPIVSAFHDTRDIDKSLSVLIVPKNGFPLIARLVM
jgi:hypothetical protein